MFFLFPQVKRITNRSETINTIMVIKIEIISDIMCPWCFVGFKRLQKAMKQFDKLADFQLHWKPFELSPKTPPEGQNILDWLKEKYKMSQNEIDSTLKGFRKTGQELGFEFNFREQTRVYNTFKAHQLLHWAEETSNKQTELKSALYEAHFLKNLNVDDINILAKIAEDIGLDFEKARAILNNKTYEKEIRKIQREIKEEGVYALPIFIFNQDDEIEGAPEYIVFENTLKKLIS